MRLTLIMGLCLALVSGCVAVPVAAPPDQPNPDGTVSFGSILARVEPVAEAECRARLPGGNCDFAIFIDYDPEAQVNAFQTILRNGRPAIILTEGLVASVRNADELAFVIGHEAAHHIRQHIPQQMDAARRGALVFGIMAQQGGADDETIRQAAELGATVAARSFSQEHELEADQLGTIITARAGYDPLLGALFFNRLPDPGDRFLGTHPPNAARQAIVRSTAASLQ